MASMPPHEREVFLMSLTPQEQRILMQDWQFWARPEQIAPPGRWHVWLVMAGRGWGKTRTGTEWVKMNVEGPTPLSRGRFGRVALVAETAADARDVMVEGRAGILTQSRPDFRPHYQPSMRRLTWPNGAVATLFSAEDPEQLRGPEHEAAWSDEMAKWRYAQETWDMLQFGLRVGESPQQLVTTTPRPIPLVRELLKGESDGSVVVTRGSTFDNATNLSPMYLKKMRDRYEGTRLGRQELEAEVLDDVVGALWTRAMLERRTAQNPMAAGMNRDEIVPELTRIVVGVDPSGTSGESQTNRDRRRESEDNAADDVGIICAGLGIDGVVYVLEDATCNLGPSGWARRVVEVYDRHLANSVVGEVNFGGAMVEHTIRTVRRSVVYSAVSASRGKAIRAEPVAALYEQGRVRHLGTFAKLEDQMIQMTRTGYEGDRSPDRLDALVWAVSALMAGRDDWIGTVSVRGHH